MTMRTVGFFRALAVVVGTIIILSSNLWAEENPQAPAIVPPEGPQTTQPKHTNPAPTHTPDPKTSSDIFDLTGMLGVGVSYSPPASIGWSSGVLMGALPSMAVANLKYGIDDTFFVEASTGFWFGENKNQGMYLDMRGGMIFAAGKHGALYGTSGLAMAFINNDVDVVDLFGVEVGPGVEYLLGGEVGIFGEFTSAMYFMPEVAFYAINGLRFGIRFYFSVL